MTVVVIILFVVAMLIVGGVQQAKKEQAERAASPDGKTKAERQMARIVCPHCQTAGQVTSRLVKRKKGISGGKATGAILTGGVSLLATGLAKKGYVTELSCRNCGVKWAVEA